MNEELLRTYYDSGRELHCSPFLLPSSRSWGKNLALKIACLGGICLLFSYVLSGTLSSLFLLFTFFFAGVPALIGAIEDLSKGTLNIDVLMSLAAFVSLFIGSGQEGGLLLVLFAFAAALEKNVRAKAKSAISALQKLSPTKAWVLRSDRSLIQRSLRDIQVGEKVWVKAGTLIPLDGRVVEGMTSVNLVHLTGENLPVTKKIGDTVSAGSHNREGAITIEVTHTSSESTLARMIQLITEAQKAKPKLGLWLDKVMSRYASFVIFATFVIALLLPLLFPISYLGAKGSIYRALAFLIAASPCALILAIPISYLSAISASAKKGIILKGGVVLDKLALCEQVALDKTGTLTTGELICIDAEGANDELLSIALAMEERSDHPMARAICHMLYQKEIKPASIENFSALFGRGLIAEYRGERVFLGKLEEEEDDGKLYTWLTYRDQKVRFTFQDAIRPQAKKAIGALHSLGLSTIILSGDRPESVALVAHELGIKNYLAKLKPEEKLDYIANGTHLAMVGDGINDAPAMARADIGISMGRMGNTTAVDVSDVVLLQDRIEHLGWLFKKARKTRRIVKQNLSLAALAILVAILPALFGWIPLWLAVMLHEGGTVIVGLNALRLLRRL